jgi:hypothetical protein
LFVDLLPTLKGSNIHAKSWERRFSYAIIHSPDPEGVEYPFKILQRVLPYAFIPFAPPTLKGSTIHTKALQRVSPIIQDSEKSYSLAGFTIFAHAHTITFTFESLRTESTSINPTEQRNLLLDYPARFEGTSDLDDDRIVRF